MNSVILIGNVSLKREPKKINDGVSVITFNVAYNDPYTKRTSFFVVETFGKTADVINQYCFVGQKVAVSGRLVNDEWTDMNGQKRTITKIVADRVELLSKQEQAPQPQQRQEQNYSFYGQTPNNYRDELTDELGF